MSNEHKIIAVYGNSGSGKTTVALKLANAIKNQDSNADVIVVGLDQTKPILPLAAPGEKTDVSMGKMLSAEFFEQEVLLKNILMVDGIGIVGLNAGENIYSHAFPIDTRIDDFFMQLRHLANYTVIDCTSDIAKDKFTAKAVINADDVVMLISADINGLVFTGSQEPLLQNEQYGYNRFKKYLTVSNKFNADAGSLKNSISQINGTIPFSKTVATAFNNGDIFKSVIDTKYNKAINNIAKELTKEV